MKTEAIKESPILMNREMVLATLEDRKLQTRRMIKQHVKPEPARFVKWSKSGIDWIPESNSGKVGIFMPPMIQCSCGTVGDRLWVKETWGLGTQGKKSLACVTYKADGESRLVMADDGGEGDFVGTGKIVTKAFGPAKWKPSIYMPRWASRITLEITEVWGERVQEISEEDAIAEGIGFDGSKYPPRIYNYVKKEWQEGGFPSAAFGQLWDSIYKNWKENPWVWVITFKRIADSR